VALPAESKPFIDFYSLKSRSVPGAFRVYRNEAVALVVSGVGRVASAAATAYLHAVGGEPCNCGWLNIGIAGHAERTVGEGVLANRITDKSTGTSWFSAPVMDLTLTTGPLVTVDTPENRYAEPVMYDMEASGFYATARRCTSLPLIQCYKVISDNRAVSTSTLRARRVEQLMGDRLREIDQLICTLQNQSHEFSSGHRAKI
jgi:adenosylhomocysteine nucleosidase